MFSEAGEAGKLIKMGTESLTGDQLEMLPAHGFQGRCIVDPAAEVRGGTMKPKPGPGD